MNNLTHEELLFINGGSQETYDNGHELGEKIRTAIVDAIDWCKGFIDGFTNS